MHTHDGRITEVAGENAQKSGPPWLQRPAPVPIVNPLSQHQLQPVDVENLELRVNKDFIRATNLKSNIYFNSEQLLYLPKMLQEDRHIAAFWKKTTAAATVWLYKGSDALVREEGEIYIYQLFHTLPCFSFVYLTTGNKAVGELVRWLTIDAVNRPMEFWIHSSLHPYDPHWPVGALETAHLSAAIALTLYWNSGLFSAEEKEVIRENLRLKGLFPCMRWLETTSAVWNFTCIIGGCALVTARVLLDEAAAARAKEKLLGWLSVVEDDGSYGEPFGYFMYALQGLIAGLMAVGPEELINALQGTPLRDTLRYMAYFYSKVHEGNKEYVGIVNFGDCDYKQKPDSLACHFFSYAFQNGLGIWLADRFLDLDLDDEDLSFGRTGIRPLLTSFYTGMFKVMFADKKQLQPVSPESIQLPKVKTFVNGIGFIRSGWSYETDSVFAIRSGGGSRTNYAHDMLNRNSIALYVNGEYMLVAPGRASYRNPIHRSWGKCRTASHNTITFARESQIENPQAVFTAAGEKEGIGYLFSDAARSYRNRPDEVLRSIFFVGDMNYYVIFDRINGKIRSEIDWNMHFNNCDGCGNIAGLGDNKYCFSRPNAYVLMALFSNRGIASTLEDGIMHRGYSYFPGGPNEGKWGDAIAWRASTRNLENNVAFACLILPRGVPATALPSVGVEAGNTAEDVFKITIKGTDLEDRFYLAGGKAISELPNPVAGDVVYARFKANKIVKTVTFEKEERKRTGRSRPL